MSQTRIIHLNRADVLILGVGPAASLAALALARQGRDVTVVGRVQMTPRIEGASPRVLALLNSFGVSCDGFGPSLRRRVVWGDLPNSPNSEHIVDRNALDAALLAQAQEAGVTFIEADIGRVSHKVVQTSAGTLRSNQMIEARGRRAAVAAGARRGPASVALCGGVAVNHRGQPELFATPLGWVWAAPLPSGKTWLQVSIDASLVARGKASLRQAWTTFFAQVMLRGHWLTDAPMPDQMHQYGTELRLSAPELDATLPRIGDAAAAFDPLSGHGLFWALSSALMLPPILSALSRGETELAQQFYKTRLHDTFWRQARIARDFFGACPQWSENQFWSARRQWPDAKPAHATRDTAQIAQRVIVENGRLKRANVLLTPQEPDGVAFVMGQALAPILTRLTRFALPQRADFAEFIPEIPPARAGSLHDWLVSRGLPVAGRLSQSKPVETLS